MKLLRKLFGLNKDRNENSIGLSKNKTTIPNEDFDLDIRKYESVNSFWEFISKQDKWYLKYSPHKIKNIENYISELEPLIIETTNELRKKMEFTHHDYWEIIEWDNLLLRAEMDDSNEFLRNKSIEFKQFCPSCEKERGFSQRYPKSICGQCVSETTDLKGKKVEFFNTEALGYGCQGYYVGTEQKEKYESELCYINEKEYFAEEGRFGGIVIQLKK